MKSGICTQSTYTVGGGKQEEDNLYYVAITRTKKHLFFVNKNREMPGWAHELDGRLGA